MKYESELIKEIVDTRGHEKSSLHYQSECVKNWINEAKGGYPKLTEYQAEWLNYIVEHPIGNFPYETLSDVTEATVDNVVPYAYRSAILKGNTLVNIFDNWANNVGTLTPVQTQDGYFLFTGENKYARVNLNYIPTFKRGVEYTFIYRIKNSTYDGENNNILRLEVGTTTIYAHTVTNGIWKIKKSFSTDETNCFVKVLSWSGSTGSAELSLQIIEGDYVNQDIPYFEGMQSVKMPVLTTTGKNLFNEDMLTSNFIKNEEGRYIVNGSSAVSSANFAIVNIDTTKIYTITVSCTTDTWCNLLIKYKNGETTSKPIGNKTTSVTTMYSDKFEVDYILAYGNSGSYVYDIQIEEGTTATPYEPYKSNILTVNEDVTLRSNGSVHDELDLLTGKLTQRIDEDGSVLTQEVIKTVDLTVKDQDGNTLSRIKPIEGTMHLSTTGTPIKPTFNGEIPVEATNQNLASFIKE